MVFLGLTSRSVAADPVPPLSPAEKNLAIESFNKKFYVCLDGVGSFKADINGGYPTFVQWAEMIELIEDAFDRTQNEVYRTMIEELHRGFIKRFGTDWTGNELNGEVLWMVIACCRAHMMTGDVKYQEQAVYHFNQIWNRAYDERLQGGLWRSIAYQSKGSDNNCAAIMAALHLYWMTGDRQYALKAEALYQWVREKLYHPESGRIADGIDAEGKITWSPSTGNQGAFIGAATLLHVKTGRNAYLADGERAVHFTRQHLTGEESSTAILKDEYPYADGGNGAMSPGFKGIFARWCSRWIRESGRSDYTDWLRENANAAWKYRNSSGVTWARWWRRTSDAYVTSWECTSAATLIQVTP